jgi:hypothetical protein
VNLREAGGSGGFPVLTEIEGKQGHQRLPHIGVFLGNQGIGRQHSGDYRFTEHRSFDGASRAIQLIDIKVAHTQELFPEPVKILIP